MKSQIPKSDLIEWQRYIEGELNGILQRKYPQYMSTYTRFREKIGPHCAYCKAAAATMFALERKNNPEFMERFTNGNWSGYS